MFEEAWNRIILVENQEVVKGVGVMWTGCHHRSSMLVKFEFDKRKWCISDPAFIMANFE
ncbi:hypothetical protein [Saccharolobus islandicus]|uniref:Uncharacterized protein n=1 Tax=Saccharolobus islandicus (strain M.16.4 / Kamchatka \|nr:hypothetical protein [Sulfolobus islandicus]ACR41559.1 conserved hypothetical protein [Sulfolobus islandicus M.16.4]